MPQIHIINNPSQFEEYNNSTWTRCSDFRSKGRCVNENGTVPELGYTGQVYRIIEKKERLMSLHERITNVIRCVFNGIQCYGIQCLSYTQFYTSIKNFINKDKVTVRFAISDRIPYVIDDRGDFVCINPVLLFNKDGWNFAVEKLDNKDCLVPVFGDKGQFTIRDDKDRLEVLFHIIQSKEMKSSGANTSVIREFLEHPANSIISEKELVDFLFEKQDLLFVRIEQLSDKEFLDVLELIDTKKISVSLQGIDLLKYSPEIATLIRKIDSLVALSVEQGSDETSSDFIKAALQDNPDRAKAILNELKYQNKSLTSEEEWVRKALEDDCNFDINIFNSLDEPLKVLIFVIANKARNENFIKRVSHLLDIPVGRFIQGYHLVAENTDIVTAKENLLEFLKGLRSEKLLLTKKEFSSLEGEYINKGNDFGRIQGAEFIKRVIKENNLKYVKVPDKILVIDDNCKAISVGISVDGLIRPGDESKKTEFAVYAKKIKYTAREQKVDELIEWMIVLMETGFNDTSPFNFLVGEDGIYFIDTEYHTFSLSEPDYQCIKSLMNGLNSDDELKFIVEFEKRKSMLEKRKKDGYYNYFSDNYIKLIDDKLENVPLEEQKEVLRKEMRRLKYVSKLGYAWNDRPYVFCLEEIANN